MNRYMGGEFELNQDFLLQQAQGNIEQKGNIIYTDTGRSALYLALQGILQYGGKKVAWLPKYCCSSVLLPFDQLGFEIKFYTIGDDLQSPAGLPTEIELAGATFLFIHYFGKKNHSIVEWLSKQQINRNFYIIEDCVQATLNDGLGNYGDFSMRSYRKFLPQPDGAVLTYRKSFAYQLADSDEEFISQRMVGKFLRGKSDNEQIFLNLFADSEKRIDGQIVPRRMSWISKYLMQRTDIQKIREKRRENWYLLHQFLKKHDLHNLLTPVYESLETNEVPLGYPILIKNGLRDELRCYLASKQIYCPIHWILDERIFNLSNNIDVEKNMSSSILTLVIDQRVTMEMLAYMVDTIIIFAKEKA